MRLLYFCVAACLAVVRAAFSLPSLQSQRPLRGLDSHSQPFTTFSSAQYPSHSLRIKEQSDDLCDAGSKQYTGWLDFNGKHLFFWYFDSLNDPENDPLTLWMTGGPGGSGLIGMMMELGPCRINNGGNGTHHNLYSWTHNSSMIFIDQPAGTGLSYVDPGIPLPGDSFVSAEDMYIFLQIFLTQVFPKKRLVPFHIAGESYGGHYVPTLAAEILRQNEQHPNRPSIPLKTILVGNGCVSLLDTTYGHYETLCTTKPGIDRPVFNETRCEIIAEQLPRCLYVGEACYAYPDEALCKAARSVCNGIIDLFYSESHAGGRDPYDITRICEVDEICYGAMLEIQDYINLPSVWSALEVPKEIRNFSIVSWAIQDVFEEGNDLYVHMMDEIKYALGHGVDVLIYNGNLDLACNSAGNLRWTTSLRWNGQAKFVSEDLQPWYSVVNDQTVRAGTYKEVYASAQAGISRKQRFAFVTIDHAGHMVPFDQPAIALDLYRSWIFGHSLRSDP